MQQTDSTVEEQLRAQRDQMRREHSIGVVRLLKGLHDRLGEPLVAALGDLAAENARARWSAAAAARDTHTIEDLIALLWEPLRPAGFEYTTGPVAGGVRVVCTRCPQAEIAAQVEGGAPLLYQMTCATDPHLAAAFNPRIGLRRAKTLMQGDDCCEFVYFYRDDAGPDSEA